MFINTHNTLTIFDIITFIHISKDKNHEINHDYFFLSTALVLTVRQKGNTL